MRFPYVIGTGTAANTQAGAYNCAQWEASLEGVDALQDGLYFVYKIPVAGNGTYGIGLNLNNLGYHPVVSQVSTATSTRYGVNANILVVYDSNLKAPLYIGGSSQTITGCWVVVNDYDANVNTLQRTFRSNSNVELPIAGISTASTSAAAYSAITSGGSKDVYAAIPETVANVATINPSTGKIKAPAGFIGNLTGTADKAIQDSSGNNITATYLTKAAGVTNITWDSTNNKLTKTINGSISDIVNISTLKTALNLSKTDVGLGNVENKSSATIRNELTNSNITSALGYTPINKAGDTMTGALILNNTTPTNALEAVPKSYVDNILTANDAMIFKGTLGTGGDFSTLPITHTTGWSYKVITAGTYAGQTCEIGDLIICIADGTSVNNAHWTVIQSNLDGTVIGPASSTENGIALYTGTTGKAIKDSGKTITTTNPSSSSNDTTIPTSKAVWGAISGASGYGKTGTVTSVRIQATSPIVSSSSAAQSTSLNTTISLANAYGDTKNPYGSKTANYVLAGPTSGTSAVPTFRALVANDIPSLTKSKISDFPTNVSDFTNDAGYLTNFTETDPTVPAWAKAETKPTYTWNEISNKPSSFTPAAHAHVTTIAINNGTSQLVLAHGGTYKLTAGGTDFIFTMPTAHKLTIGTYEFDGSEDVTIPVYTGTIV